MCRRGSGAPRRPWRLLNSGLRISRRCRLESAMHATAVRAGWRARMLPMTPSEKTASSGELSVAGLFLFPGSGALGAAFSRSSAMI